MEENMITIIDEDGNEQLHEILLTFELDDYDKQYVVFAPVGTDDEDLIHVASYIPDESGEVGTLNDIEEDEEWALVEEVINTFFDDEEE